MTNFTPRWEDVREWDARPASDASRLAMKELRQHQDAMHDSPTGLACVTYDEERAEIVISAADDSIQGNHPLARDVQVTRDTDAALRQNDKGPYHWAQGPIDLRPVTGVSPAPTPPVVPSPNPEPVTPGVLPRKGKAITTTNLRLRKSYGTRAGVKGVMQTGTEVLLTGGRRRVDGTLWVRIQVDTAELSNKPLSGDDKWLSAPPKQVGWVNSEYLAVPASEYVAQDFPPVTHEYLWWLEDAGGLNADDVRRTFTAISDDPRGPLRAGIDLREATSPEEADVLIRMVDSACGGAAGCYYKRSGEKARVDIQVRWFNTAWLSRVFLHETLGHSATRSYDHYSNAPQYPRTDYFGLMGNWTDHYGDHAWPDADDIDNFIEWKEGRSGLVFVRDSV